MTPVEELTETTGPTRFAVELVDARSIPDENVVADVEAVVKAGRDERYRRVTSGRCAADGEALDVFIVVVAATN